MSVLISYPNWPKFNLLLNVVDICNHWQFLKKSEIRNHSVNVALRQVSIVKILILLLVQPQLESIGTTLQRHFCSTVRHHFYCIFKWCIWTYIWWRAVGHQKLQNQDLVLSNITLSAIYHHVYWCIVCLVWLPDVCRYTDNIPGYRIRTGISQG